MSIIINIYLTIKGFCIKVAEDNVSIYSAQASFYIVLSAIPLIMLILTIIGLTDIPESAVLSISKQIVPNALDSLMEQVVEEIYAKSSGTIISVTAVTAAWTASKGVLSIMRGLQSIYHTNDKRNYFIQRFISVFYTLIFVFAIVFSLGILVFGNRIYNFLADQAPILHDIIGLFIQNRALISLCFLTLFFLLLYKIVRKSGYTLGDLFPGALFAASGWMIFSFAFSIYIDNFSNYANMYGSLTTIILLFLWLYACMYILFLGAEINVYFKESFTRMKRIHQYKKAVEKKKKETNN